MKTDEKYEKLVEISEKKNPYFQECPNRHLWSEGYRAAMVEVERTASKTCKWQMIPYWKFDCGIPRCIDERTAQFILGEYCPFCGRKIERV